MTYKYLTTEQIDFLTKHYANQETADEVQDLITQAKLNIENHLVEFDDGTADLIIRKNNEDKAFFSNFCTSPYWLTPNIQAFGGGVDIALNILNKVFGWTKETTKSLI